MRRINVREVELNAEERQIHDTFNDYVSRGFSLAEATAYAVIFYLEDNGWSAHLDPLFVMYLSDNTLAWDDRARQLLDRCSRLPVWGQDPKGVRRRETITHAKNGCGLSGRDFLLELGREDGTVIFHEWITDPEEISDVNCPRCFN